MDQITGKKVVAMSIAAATALGLTGCQSKLERIVQNLDETNYAEVMRIYSEWDMRPEEREPFLAAMREEMAETIDEFAQNVITFEQATATMDTLRNINVYELQEDLTLAYAELQVLQTSKEMFLSGEEAMAKGEYLNAINFYKKVSEADCNYEPAQGKLQEARDAYVGQVIADAQAMVDKSQYDSAIGLLRQASTALGGDKTFEEKIVEIQVQKALAEAAKLAEKKDYKGALDVLNTYKTSGGKENEQINNAYKGYLDAHIKTVLAEAETYAKSNNFEKALSVLKEVTTKYDRENKQILNAYEKYSNDYVTSVLQKVDAFMEERSYSAYSRAQGLLDSAYDLVPSEKLRDKMKIIKEQRPTFLCELEPVNHNRFDSYTSGDIFYDTLGNPYQVGNLHIVSSKEASWEETEIGYAEYYLGYEYATLTGVIAVEANSSNINSSVKIEADGVTIFTLDLSRLSEPYPFKIDVSGVNFLTIRGGDPSGEGTFNTILYELALSK